MKPKLPAPHRITRPVSRRTFLRGTGVAMLLPWLDAMNPRAAHGAVQVPRRLFAICNNLGLRPDLFFPTSSGRGYEASAYLKLLDAHRDAFAPSRVTVENR